MLSELCCQNKSTLILLLLCCFDKIRSSCIPFSFCHLFPVILLTESLHTVAANEAGNETLIRMDRYDDKSVSVM